MRSQSPDGHLGDGGTRDVRCVNDHKVAEIRPDGRIVVRCRCKHDVTVNQGDNHEHGKEEPVT